MSNSGNNTVRYTADVSGGKDTVNSEETVVNGVRNNDPAINERLVNTKSKKLKKLPLLINCSKEKLDDLLLKKIRQCFIVFKDPTENSTELKCIELKASILKELIEFVSDSNDIPASAYPDIFKMFSINIFRDLPPPKSSVGAEFDLDDEDSQLNQSDPIWSHLQLVYELFLRFIEIPNFNVTLSKAYVNQKFVVQLLNIFESEDFKERDLLKAVLHRIYGKFLNLRSFIRKKISYVFYTFIYETERHSGIPELLEVLASIINGFALPLKYEHKTFLLKTLMPLHMVKSLATFHTNLMYCVIQYLEKDPSLTEPVVKSLLRFWPKTNSTKELLFLEEVFEILCIAGKEDLKEVLTPLLNQLSKCALKPHIQVRDKALNIYNSENILCLLSELEINDIISPKKDKNNECEW